MDDLTAIEEWAETLLAKLSPGARRAAAVDIGRELRRRQKDRIGAQLNPDGSAFAPRKPRIRGKQGRIKRRAMFAKLRTAKYLKLETDSNGLALGFSGRAARLALVHQQGGSGEVAPGRSYQYPVRQLLGFTESDREMIRDKLLEHVTR